MRQLRQVSWHVLDTVSCAKVSGGTALRRRSWERCRGCRAGIPSLCTLPCLGPYARTLRHPGGCVSLWILGPGCRTSSPEMQALELVWGVIALTIIQFWRGRFRRSGFLQDSDLDFIRGDPQIWIVSAFNPKHIDLKSRVYFGVSLPRSNPLVPTPTQRTKIRRFAVIFIAHKIENLLTLRA